MKQNDIAIVVLSAGSSQRMGKPKQLLKIGDKPLLEVVLDHVNKLKEADAFVVLGANEKRIKEGVITGRAKILTNKKWELGIGSSIVFAVDLLTKKGYNYAGILFILGDQPFVDSYYLKEIIDEYRSSDKKIIATSYGNSIGIPALFDQSFFEELKLLPWETGAKPVIEKNLDQTKALIPTCKLIDIDTPKDYEDLIRSEQ